MKIYDSFYKKIRILQNSSKAFISNIIVLMQSEFFSERKEIYACDEVPEKSKFIYLFKFILY